VKTIDPQHAQDLFYLYDDHELLHDDPESERFLHGYTVLGSVESGNTGRWHERYWMVLRDDADGSVWGVEYGVGLTENQEDDYPWERGGGKPIPLVRLDRRERTVVEYVKAAA
jgi:hypothetical protein